MGDIRVGSILDSVFKILKDTDFQLLYLILDTSDTVHTFLFNKGHPIRADIKIFCNLRAS